MLDKRSCLLARPATKIRAPTLFLTPDVRF
jgi:hypothetical protein